MNPEQALKNLDQAAGQLPANREIHDVMKQSAAVLDGVIKEWAKYLRDADEVEG